MRVQITKPGVSTDDDEGTHPVGAIIDVPGDVMPARFVNKAVIVATPKAVKPDDNKDDKKPSPALPKPKA